MSGLVPNYFYPRLRPGRLKLFHIFPPFLLSSFPPWLFLPSIFLPNKNNQGRLILKNNFPNLNSQSIKLYDFKKRPEKVECK